MYKKLLIIILLGLNACSNDITKFRYSTDNNFSGCGIGNRTCERDERTFINGIFYDKDKKYDRIMFYIDGELKISQSSYKENKIYKNTTIQMSNYNQYIKDLRYGYNIYNDQEYFNYINCRINNPETEENHYYELKYTELHDALNKTNGKLNCKIINKYIKENKDESE